MEILFWLCRQLVAVSDKLKKKIQNHPPPKSEFKIEEEQSKRNGRFFSQQKKPMQQLLTKRWPIANKKKSLQSK